MSTLLDGANIFTDEEQYSDESSRSVLNIGGTRKVIVQETNDEGEECVAISVNRLVASTNTSINGEETDDIMILVDSQDGSVNSLDGNDIVITYGSASNTISGGNGNDIINVIDSVNNSIQGGSGNDIIQVDGGNNNTAQGNVGNDIIIARDTSVSTVKGGVGNDIIALRDLRANGTYVVDNTEFGKTDRDILSLSQYDRDEFSFELNDDSDLVLTHANGATITIAGWAEHQLAKVMFKDDTVKGSALVKEEKIVYNEITINKGGSYYATNENDSFKLSGFNNNITISGMSSADRLDLSNYSLEAEQRIVKYFYTNSQGDVGVRIGVVDAMGEYTSHIAEINIGNYTLNTPPVLTIDKETYYLIGGNNIENLQAKLAKNFVLMDSHSVLTLSNYNNATSVYLSCFFESDFEEPIAFQKDGNDLLITVPDGSSAVKFKDTFVRLKDYYLKTDVHPHLILGEVDDTVLAVGSEGNDIVNLSEGKLPPRMVYYAGAGNDTINAGNGDWFIYTGDGCNEVNIDNDGGVAYIAGAKSQNNITVNNAVEVMVDAGCIAEDENDPDYLAGNLIGDTVNINGALESVIRGNSGKDTISIVGTGERDSCAYVDGGDSDDVISIAKVQEAELQGGQGNDKYILDWATCGKVTIINANDGLNGKAVQEKDELLLKGISSTNVDFCTDGTKIYIVAKGTKWTSSLSKYVALTNWHDNAIDKFVFDDGELSTAEINTLAQNNIVLNDTININASGSYECNASTKWIILDKLGLDIKLNNMPYKVAPRNSIYKLSPLSRTI